MNLETRKKVIDQYKLSNLSRKTSSLAFKPYLIRSYKAAQNLVPNFLFPDLINTVPSNIITSRDDGFISRKDFFSLLANQNNSYIAEKMAQDNYYIKDNIKYCMLLGNRVQDFA